VTVGHRPASAADFDGRGVVWLAGAKGRHNPDRTPFGTEPGQVTFGGRRVRIRSADRTRKVAVLTYQEFATTGPA
jgi:hypothetical protein